MIQVCICTHSSDPITLEKVLKALCKQTLSPDQFNLLIIDNANEPPISLKSYPYSALKSGKMKIKIIKEPLLGIAHARIRALRETDAEVIVFVDDDNVLADDFLKNAKKIIKENPEVGCFSGKMLIPQGIKVPKWIEPLLGSLAIRNIDGPPIIDWFRGEWHPWLPTATASMVLRREVAEAFLKNHASRSEFLQFGRKGRYGLMSGEDFLIALSAADANLKCGYFSELVMYHFIRPGRLTLQHMARLMSLYAITDLKREIYMNWPPEPFLQDELRYRLMALDYKGKDIRARFCYWLYQTIYTLGKTYRLTKARKPLFKSGESNVP